MGQRGEVHRKCWCLLVGRFPWETSTGKSRRSLLPINERRGFGLSVCNSPHVMNILGPCAPAHGHRKSSAVMAARCEVASHLTASIAPDSILMINSKKDLLQTVYSECHDSVMTSKLFQPVVTVTRSLRLPTIACKQCQLRVTKFEPFVSFLKNRYLTKT